MSEFSSLLLWAVDGKIRRKANPEITPSSWEPRNIVLAAPDFKAAHALAAEAMLNNWSQHPHEVVLHSVRPASAADLKDFAFVSDPAFRVLISSGDGE